MRCTHIFSVCDVNLCTLSMPYRIDMYYGRIYCSTLVLGSADFNFEVFVPIPGYTEKVEEILLYALNDTVTLRRFYVGFSEKRHRTTS